MKEDYARASYRLPDCRACLPDVPTESAMMSRLPLMLLGVLPMLGGCANGLAADPEKPKATKDPVSFAKQVAPILSKYCIGCHGGEKPKADLAFDKYKDEVNVLKEAERWTRVAERLELGEMPPKDKPRPTHAEIELIARWIDAELAQADCLKKDPGRVTMRRLNRAEYNNTIRDLLGVDFKPAADFPADDVGYGFDNIGDVLSLPPMLMEKYLAAAEKIVAAAWKNPESKKRILIAELSGRGQRENARRILENFATRAWRRPAQRDEVRRLMTIVELVERNGDSYETGIQLACQAVLASPNFIFKVELDAPAKKQESGVRSQESGVLLNDFELATRLSYFLWSSMPDDELFQHAKEGTLRKDDNLPKQVRRMLKDSKLRSGLVENFAGQWLQIRNLSSMTPDPKEFPTFDEPLRQAMLKETELFFEAVVQEDRSILDFIDGKFTFVNERLARHYGIPELKGDEFRRVELKGDQRGGIITHASLLTVTSNPTRTSPVKRGKYILENILGTPPPPPPPEVPELDEPGKPLVGTLRQRMEQHRVKPDCAVCHQKMDPLGFALENYDGIGAWRTRDGKDPIDASGELGDGPTGEKFRGPEELRQLLRKKEDAVRRCLTEKLLTYALGRGLEYADKCHVDPIVAAVKDEQNRFSALVLEIVKSEPFQMRRAKGAGEAKGRNMDSIGVIRSKPGAPALDRKAWMEMIRSHPNLKSPEPRKGTNPFTGEPTTFQPAPDVARVIGSMAWSQSGQNEIYVSGDAKVVGALARDIAEKLGGQFDASGS